MTRAIATEESTKSPHSSDWLVLSPRRVPLYLTAAASWVSFGTGFLWLFVYREAAMQQSYTVTVFALGGLLAVAFYLCSYLERR